MDLPHIHTHLKRLFSSGGHDHAGNRIVWWQDREGEFAEELDKLDLENCHEDGVALIRLGEESTLALKVRMLLEEPKARFLIYERGALPDPAHDMLLDIRKWAAPFAADKSTLILRELGLIDEYQIVVHPRIIGRGPTLFAGLSKMVDLKLVGREEFGSGAVAMRYEVKR